MTGPIISPSYLYWIGAFDDIKTASFTLSAITLIGAIVALICYICNRVEQITYDRDIYGKYAKISMHIFVPCLIISLILMTAAILLPSKETSYMMLIGKVATYENVDLSVESIKEIVDYIVQAFHL